MKKAAVLTVTGDNNYGNKLQNYALQHVLEQFGLDVETVRVEKVSYSRILFLTYLQKFVYKLLPSSKNKTIDRRICFFQFNKKIHQHHTVIKSEDKKDEISKKLSKFDYLFYGSDQIWNPDLPQYSDVFWGMYAPKEKNIAVSASIGRSSIPDGYVKDFEKGVQNFRAISVRENAAKDLIKNLPNGMEPAVLIDPTMMLDCNTWTALESGVDTPVRYCLTYYLGKESSSEVEKIAEDRQCEMVDMGPGASYGPSEFIYLVRNSQIVITDSFHAAVFSILFGKDLYIVQRQDQYASMNSRIETLLEKTGIKPEIIGNMLRIEENAINDVKVQKNLEMEREQFRNYLKGSLGQAE